MGAGRKGRGISKGVAQECHSYCIDKGCRLRGGTCSSICNAGTPDVVVHVMPCPCAGDKVRVKRIGVDRNCFGKYMGCIIDHQ